MGVSQLKTKCISTRSVVMEAVEARRMLASAVDGVHMPAEATSTLPARQVEYLTRGVNAIYQSNGRVYVNWRFLGTDASTTSFNLYRKTGTAAAVKLNSTPIINTTDWVDVAPNVTLTNEYFVKPVIGGIEQAASESFTLPASPVAQQYRNVPLQIPLGGTTPAGEVYTYNANDTSAADLDGDGEYELIVKWEPSNSKDNSQSGYTGNVYLDAYKLDGTQMWRIDLGRNIRAGAHYTQFIVYDLDGDGKAEMGVKTAPGTIDGLGNPVLLGSDTVTADYRSTAGYILTGPEYLTIFNGETGANMSTIYYQVPRGTVSNWGDSYGNRVDRFLAGVAYLDGVRPSLLMCRGYYTRTVIWALDWRNGTLSQRWLFDTGNSTTGPLAGYRGQGDHSLTVGDVDGDGKDEITYGAMAINDDGTPLYTTGLGHGDALHMSDMDPNRPGLEVYNVHEDQNAHQGKGGDLRDAATGQVLAFVPGTGDVGRGVAIDLDPRYPGFEMWNSSDGGIYNVSGTRIQDKPSNMPQNFAIWWDGDPLRELLDGTTIGDWRIDATTGNGYRQNLVFGPAGLTGNNGTKNTPSLTADLYGDWREEVVWRRSDNSALQIWSTTYSAQQRITTLMHDIQYREAVAWQNVAYNQPPHTSFFIGQDMVIPDQPNVFLASVPTIVAVASASPSPVTGTTTTLSVTAADANGEAGLTYLWATTGTPPAAVTFSANSTNAAKSTIATFSKIGTYNFRVTATNASGFSATSNVTVVVSPTSSSIVVTPSTSTVSPLQSRQLTASVKDQFGATMAVQPVLYWAVTSGNGTVDNAGLYVAGNISGTDTVEVTDFTVSSAATITVASSAPAITSISATPSAVTGKTTALSAVATDDSGQVNLIYTWAATTLPSGAQSPTFSMNASNSAKNCIATFRKAGNYVLTLTARDTTGLTATTTVKVSVAQTATSIVVSPSAFKVTVGTQQQFKAVAYDQFGLTMTTQPVFTWSATSGSITTAGLFTAGAVANAAVTITATASSKTGAASVTTRAAGIPLAPSSVTIKKLTTTSHSLSWRDNSTDETSFHIQYGTGPSASQVNWTTSISTTAKQGAVNTMTYTFTNAFTAGQTYYFRIRAINGSGASGWTNVVQMTM